MRVRTVHTLSPPWLVLSGEMFKISVSRYFKNALPGSVCSLISLQNIFQTADLRKIIYSKKKKIALL